jgi:hypothetical protein
MNTLLLDLTNWDLITDSAGNIAVASDPWSVAQDVASAVRVFQTDLWYHQSDGIPYFQQILGHLPPANLFKSLLAARAATVPGCNNPVVFLAALQGRTVAGQIQFTDSNGKPQVAAIGVPISNQWRSSDGTPMFDPSGNPMFG